MAWDSGSVSLTVRDWCVTMCEGCLEWLKRVCQSCAGLVLGCAPPLGPSFPARASLHSEHDFLSVYGCCTAAPGTVYPALKLASCGVCQSWQQADRLSALQAVAGLAWAVHPPKEETQPASAGCAPAGMDTVKLGGRTLLSRDSTVALPSLSDTELARLHGSQQSPLQPVEHTETSQEVTAPEPEPPEREASIAVPAHQEHIREGLPRKSILRSARVPKRSLRTVITTGLGLDSLHLGRQHSPHHVGLNSPSR